MHKAILIILVMIMAGCSQPELDSEQKKELDNSEVEYTRLTPTDFRKRIGEAPIAYLPLGTLEWHGEHLPLGSDGMQSFSFMKDLAREVGGIVLPMDTDPLPDM
jgi:hypothetical protein